MTISAAYCFKSSEVEPNERTTEDWLLVEDPISVHISGIDAKYYLDLLEAHLNERIQTSKFAASIGSATVENEAHRLFEAQSS